MIFITTIGFIVHLLLLLLNLTQKIAHDDAARSLGADAEVVQAGAI